MSANIYRGGIIGGKSINLRGVWGVGDNGITYVDVPFDVKAKATGGIISFDKRGFIVHTFVSSGTFATTSGPLNVEYVVVAGGAPGGTGYGGGGGAGGLVTNIGSSALTTGPRVVTVGGVGSPSSFGPGITATGGGAGGPNAQPGTPGGSGGGASRAASGSSTVGDGIPGQGNPGGIGPTHPFGSGYGGGGAGAPGNTSSLILPTAPPAVPMASRTEAGPGGDGLAFDFGDGLTYYAGGGGGGTTGAPPVGARTYGLGGLGGGGHGFGVANPIRPAVPAAAPGQFATGGGGGGGPVAGLGGSGVVIVRYPT